MPEGDQFLCSAFHKGKPKRGDTNVKIFEFIVHFAVICTIVCVLGLALPPFFGVRTVIMDSTDKATNLPLGSVTYAIPVRTEEVTAGSPILVQEDGKTYKYNLVSVNRENNTGTVIDTTTSAQESITVSVKNWVPKIVITIPFVGYLLVATESVEGLIVLGLVILFLIILYVIAELWRKDPDDDEYEDLQGDTRHVKSSRELKAEEKARAKRMKQEDKELLQDAKEKKKKSKKEEKKKKKIRTGGFVDEIDEDDLDDEPEETVRPAGNVQAATSEAHELLKKEIAAATAEEETEAPESYPEISGEPAESTVSEEEFPEEEIEEEPPVEIKKLAIPRRTASQLANRARKEGDAPDVVRDSVTKVTLFDYSDIIGGDEEEEE